MASRAIASWATAVLAGFRRGAQNASTAWAIAFSPLVTASVRGSDAVSSGS